MSTKETKKEQEVLFQKLGETWYIFSEVDGEIIYSSLPPGVNPKNTKLELYHIIEDHMKKVSKIKSPTRPPETAA